MGRAFKDMCNYFGPATVLQIYRLPLCLTSHATLIKPKGECLRTYSSYFVMTPSEPRCSAKPQSEIWNGTPPRRVSLRPLHTFFYPLRWTHLMWRIASVEPDC